LGKGGANDVSGQVFSRLAGFITGLDSWSAENVETRMTPFHEHVNQVFRDLAFGKEHLKDLIPEDLFQVFQVEQWRHTERAVSVKTTFAAGHFLLLEQNIWLFLNGIANRFDQT